MYMASDLRCADRIRNSTGRTYAAGAFLRALENTFTSSGRGRGFSFLLCRRFKLDRWVALKLVFLLGPFEEVLEAWN